uniref:Uncharacterized protein n=1 Tax=Prolemur simus TaxID=1328070 RepID=A0A8C8YZQ2_PROSS
MASPTVKACLLGKRTPACDIRLFSFYFSPEPEAAQSLRQKPRLQLALGPCEPLLSRVTALFRRACGGTEQHYQPNNYRIFCRCRRADYKIYMEKQKN